FPKRPEHIGCRAIRAGRVVLLSIRARFEPIRTDSVGRALRCAVWRPPNRTRRSRPTNRSRPRATWTTSPRPTRRRNRRTPRPSSSSPARVEAARKPQLESLTYKGGLTPLRQLELPPWHGWTYTSEARRAERWIEQFLVVPTGYGQAQRFKVAGFQ